LSKAKRHDNIGEEEQCYESESHREWLGRVVQEIDDPIQEIGTTKDQQVMDQFQATSKVKWKAKCISVSHDDGGIFLCRQLHIPSLLEF
jgi:hypothetical protein